MAPRSPSSTDGPRARRTEQLVAAMALWSHRHPKAVIGLSASVLGAVIVQRVLEPVELPWGLLIAAALCGYYAVRVFDRAVAALLVVPSLVGAIVGLGFADSLPLESSLMLFALGIDQGFRVLPVVRSPERSSVLESFRGEVRTVIPAGVAMAFGLAAFALTQRSATLAIAAAALATQTLAQITLLPALLGITRADWAPEPMLEERWPRRILRWAPTLGWAAVLFLIALWPHTEGSLVTLDLSWLDLAIGGGTALVVLGMLRGPVVAISAALAGFFTVGLTTGALAALDELLVPEQGIGLLLLFGLSFAHGGHLAHRHGDDHLMTLRRRGSVVSQASWTVAVALYAVTIATPLGAQGTLLQMGLVAHAFVTLAAMPALAAMFESARNSGDKGGLLPRLAVTVGLAGDAPVGPGTLGALVAVPIGFGLQSWGVVPSIVVAVVLTALSIPITTRYLERTGRHDPSEVVLDELVGCLLAMVMVPFGLLWGWAAFGLFRLFDITKPGPVRWAERRAPGAWGVIGDDVIAGLMAGTVLLGFRWAGTNFGWWS